MPKNCTEDLKAFASSQLPIVTPYVQTVSFVIFFKIYFFYYGFNAITIHEQIERQVAGEQGHEVMGHLGQLPNWSRSEAYLE